MSTDVESKSPPDPIRSHFDQPIPIIQVYSRKKVVPKLMQVQESDSPGMK